MQSQFNHTGDLPGTESDLFCCSVVYGTIKYFYRDGIHFHGCPNHTVYDRLLLAT